MFCLFLENFQKFIYFLFPRHKNITVLNTDLIEHFGFFLKKSKDIRVKNMTMVYDRYM